uniref:Uncharacterized protein n=1 Tax=Rhizophora mucronata TaxID=61149 RepID=A0A2P2QWP3_RHIMU
MVKSKQRWPESIDQLNQCRYGSEPTNSNGVEAADYRRLRWKERIRNRE